MDIRLDSTYLPEFIERAHEIKEQIVDDLSRIDPNLISNIHSEKNSVRKTIQNSFTKKKELLTNIDDQIKNLRNLKINNVEESIKQLSDLRKDVASIWQVESEIHAISSQLKSTSKSIRDQLLRSDDEGSNVGLDKASVKQFLIIQKELENKIEHVKQSSLSATQQLKTNEQIYLQEKIHYLNKKYQDINKAVKFFGTSIELNTKSIDLDDIQRPMLLTGRAAVNEEIFNVQQEQFYAALRANVLVKNWAREATLSEIQSLAKRIKQLNIQDTLTPEMKEEHENLQCLAFSIAAIWNIVRKPSEPFIPTIIYKDEAFVKFTKEAKEAVDICKSIVTVAKKLSSLTGKTIEKGKLPEHLIDYDVEDPNKVTTEFITPEAIGFSMASDGINAFTSACGIYFSAIDTYAKIKKTKVFNKQIKSLEQTETIRTEDPSEEGSTKTTILNRPLYVKLKRKVKKLRVDIGIGVTSLVLNVLDLGNSILNLIKSAQDLAITSTIADLTQPAELISPVSEVISDIAGPLGVVVGCIGVTLGAYFTVKGFIDLIKSEKLISRSKRQIIKHQERRTGILRTLDAIDDTKPKGLAKKKSLMRELRFSNLELRRSRHKEFALRKKRALKILQTSKTAFFTISGAVLLTLALTVSGIGIPLAIASLTLAVLSLISFFALHAYEKHVNKGISLSIKNQATKEELERAFEEISYLPDVVRKVELRNIYEMLEKNKIQSIMHRLHQSHQKELEKQQRTPFPKDDQEKIIDLFQEYAKDALEMYYWGIIN